MITNKNKYHARKTDGYDSRKEAYYANLLQQQQEEGAIHDLREKVRYQLLPTQRDTTTGKILERPAFYTCDFDYYDNNGTHIVLDVKSPITRKAKDYILRRKLMLYINHIRITEK